MNKKPEAISRSCRLFLSSAQDQSASQQYLVDGAAARAVQRSGGKCTGAENEEVYCELRYQGQIYDAETRLYYNRHRYYDAQSGQYISPDPIGLGGGLRPQSYVTNPLELCDPLGLAKNDASRKTAAELTDEEFAQRVGDKAERWGVRNGHGSAGSGHVQGSKKHKYTDDLMQRYQRMTGQKMHLETESYYLNKLPASRNTPGSARPDVYNPQTGEVFDYKFTRSSTSPISQRQQQHNINNLPKVSSQTAIHPR